MTLKFHDSRKNAGLSLIETLIYVALFAVFVIALVFFSSKISSFSARAQVISEINRQGVQSLKTLTQAIRNSSAIISPATSTSGDMLVLSSDETVTFSLSNGVLYRTDGSGPAAPLTYGDVYIRDLIFHNLSKSSTSGSLSISFTVGNATSSPTEVSHSVDFWGGASIR
ncbi:MAG TPA: prepilin-type N-terminal cleavage/methylation domain-containing protein [Candidatus Paceibacterota bacterium]|nr:prepilin-type N-terminal cleavage/methylation domain-containing protein [Candidatus Paceibacterota bacterium]HRZ34675.1 prepilin-type N-terminal cleavage/methylation domain-containing protein [Candidatus Paceibacterota bacterium]